MSVFVSVGRLGPGLGAGLTVSLALVLSGCTGDDPADTAPDAAPEPPQVSVTVPPERLTPFCQEMIDLTDRLRTGDVDDAEATIVETYRRIADDAPNAIVDDFRLVLAALEAGEPPPTDPPRDTVATLAPSVTTDATVASTDAPPVTPTDPATGSSAPRVIDEAFAPGDSPSERINSYVEFECRDTANNPGPPPTPPQAPPEVES